MSPIGQEIQDLKIRLWELVYADWYQNELFSASWWGLVIGSLLIYAVWLRVLDKKRIIEILLFGSLVTVMATFTDVYATQANTFSYNIQILPTAPALFPLDFIMIPVPLMIAYQYGHRWSNYLVTAGIASAFYAFVITPILVANGILTMYRWSYLWAFAEGMSYAVIAKSALTYLKTLSISEQRDRIQTFIAQPAMKPDSDNDNNHNK